MKLLTTTVITAAMITACLGGPATAATSKAAQQLKQISGSASWYGGTFHGRKTANGERYNMYGMTAAHKSLPFGTKVRVTNQKNGKAVVVRINDRGPYVGKRVIDLSKGAATAVGMIGSGVAPVKIEVLK
jgi:rare lipoprotein A